MSLTLTDRQTIWGTFCRTLTNDPNPAVRAKAATAIGKLHDPKFSPTLLTALTDESPSSVKPSSNPLVKSAQPQPSQNSSPP
jgi:HEAT repeat protein